MKTTLLLIFLAATVYGEYQNPDDFYPFPDKPGTASTTAVHRTNTIISGWADGYTNVIYGTDVSEDWKTPQKALGQAVGDSFDIVSLGRGGQITLTFSQAITNGSGFDFAVFENAMDDYFLELAWVEVSSDGQHFVRFPNYYRWDSPVGAFGTHDTRYIYGLASKYRQGYGTPFDLSELQDAYDAVTNGTETVFTTNFITALTNNFSHLDLNHISHIRFIDIVGDGNADDAEGHVIYDPWPTIGSAGFDLEAVAAFYQAEAPNTFSNWAAEHGLSGDPSDDFDGDGNADLEEYFLGTSPTNLSEKASFSGSLYSNQFKIIYHRDPDALGTIDIATVTDLTQTNWVVATPDSVTSNATAESIEVKVVLPAATPQGFYRLRFEGADE